MRDTGVSRSEYVWKVRRDLRPGICWLLRAVDTRRWFLRLGNLQLGSQFQIVSIAAKRWVTPALAFSPNSAHHHASHYSESSAFLTPQFFRPNKRRFALFMSRLFLEITNTGQGRRFSWSSFVPRQYQAPYFRAIAGTQEADYGGYTEPAGRQ